MLVNSNCPEFGYELLSALPFAYNQYLKGNLTETISGFDTSCLYFFSPKHTETNCIRSWDNMKKLWNTNFPNINIHRSNLDWDLFTPPPLKEYYKDKSINFKKEKIIIFNRYNKEWGGPPINYLDLNTLDKLFSLLSDDYQVIYINLTKGDKYFDGAKPLVLNDESILKKHPKVLTIYDIIDQNPKLTYNETQLRLFANCTKFVSSNGGQLILSAYFGGENIIFSKKCRELEPNVNSFYRWYHKLGGGTFQHVNNYQDLIQLVTEKWVQKKPLINILIRTSGRPNYFKECINSIYSQTYKNWNVIVGVDEKVSKNYTQPEKCLMVEYDYSNYVYPEKPKNDEYGVGFKYNLYLNNLQKMVNDGYIIYLDDDDKLWDVNSLKRLVNVIKNENDLIFWRVKFPNRLVPSDNNFNKPPVLKDISGIGFAFHNKYKIDWEPFKRGDYRVAKTLYAKIPNKIYLNEILTGLQRTIEDGFGRRDDKTEYDLSIIIPTYNNIEYLDESLNSIINSGKNHNIEILVGIDGCEKTLNHIKQKTYPDFVKFYYFSSNNGPYIVKNTLSQIVNSDKILFFDSDDITEKESIQKLITLSRDYQVVRPKYVDFNLNRKTLGTNHGEGVFMIDKKLFLDMNGFEPWRVAADTEFMNRVRLKNVKTYLTPEILFKRRIHPQGLTSRKDTGIGSTLRNKYIQLMNNKKGLQNPSEQHIANYEIVTENILIKKLPEVKKTDLSPVLNKQPRKIVENKIIKPPKKPISPDLAELLKPKNNVPPRPQNKEKFYADINPIKTQQALIRQTLIEQKKNTTISHMLKGMGIKKGGGNIGGKFST
jgi:glycosyltransferase involved in cell wall biosynthesis